MLHGTNFFLSAPASQPSTTSQASGSVGSCCRAQGDASGAGDPCGEEEEPGECAISSSRFIDSEDVGGRKEVGLRNLEEGLSRGQHLQQVTIQNTGCFGVPQFVKDLKFPATIVGYAVPPFCRDGVAVASMVPSLGLPVYLPPVPPPLGAAAIMVPSAAPSMCVMQASATILFLLFPNHPSIPLSLIPLTAQAASSKPWMGVNLGVGLSSNPVSLTRAVAIIKQRGFSAVKLFQPDPTALNALAASGLQVMTCVPNERLGDFAKSDSAALAWLDANIMPFMSKTNILAIAVGNEVLSPDNPFLGYVVPAMESLYKALTARKLHRRVKLVTPQHMSFLQDTYPPSSAQVVPSVRDEVTRLLSFLNRTGSYAVLNAYPFFSYLADPVNIPRDFVFFKGGAGSYDDKGRRYSNMMEATIDAALWSFEKLGFPNMPFVVGETGWPTAGAAIASPSAAKEWNTGLVSFLLSGRGTPKRRNSPIRAYLFEMFDEDRKDTTMGGRPAVRCQAEPAPVAAAAAAPSAVAALPFRVGHGFDLHRLEPNLPLIIGGVNIPHDRGCDAHSDGDVLLHSLPDNDPKWKGAASHLFLEEAVRRMHEAGYTVGNLDATVILQRPKLSPHKPTIKANLAALLQAPEEVINVKAKTHEKVDSLGENRSVGCHCVVLLMRKE
ncbi:unnamed protein product [Closterium sp. Yama58-4]|nr:unnamed protein product [Closterium sp. Yama58-4]